MGMGHIPPRDSSGRPIQRGAATIDGWHYYAREFEICLSIHNGVKSFDETNTACTDFSCKIFDSGDVEITDPLNQANAVRTQLIWSPTYDYEVLGGKIHQYSRPVNNVRLSACGGPVDLGLAYCKPFVPSLNLKFIDPAQEIETDGRASKYMKKVTEGVGVDTNKFEVNVYYTQGDTHEFTMIFETFKA